MGFPSQIEEGSKRRTSSLARVRATYWLKSKPMESDGGLVGRAERMTTARARQRMLGRCKRKWQSWGQTKNKHGKRKQAAMAQCELTAARLAPHRPQGCGGCACRHLRVLINCRPRPWRNCLAECELAKRRERRLTTHIAPCARLLANLEADWTM